MTQEMKAKKSIQNVLIEKPNVARVYAQKSMEEKNRDKFYGPNLQVIWGENATSRGGGGVKEGEVCLYACKYICIYIYMYMYTYIYIYIYI
jgi:hypothetical protein